MHRQAQSELSRIFHEHTSAIFRFMQRRVERLYGSRAVLPFTLRELRAWLIDTHFNGSVEAAIACAYCRTWLNAGNFVLDHHDPLFFGGALGFDNLNVTCESCNTLKGRMTAGGFQALLDFATCLPPEDVNDMFSRMKNGSAYIRLQVEKHRAEKARYVVNC